MSNFQYQSIITVETDNNGGLTVLALPYGCVNFQIIEPIRLLPSSRKELDNLIQELTTLLNEIHQYNFDELRKILVGFAELKTNGFFPSKCPILPKFYDQKNRTLIIGDGEAVNRYFKNSGTHIYFGVNITDHISSKYTLNSEDSIIKNCLSNQFTVYKPKPDNRKTVYVDGVCRYSENDKFKVVPFHSCQPNISFLFDGSFGSVFADLI